MAMKKSSEQLGVVTALLERLEKQRLPRLLSLKDNVNCGEVLSHSDLSFLKEVSTDAKRIEPFLDNLPQYQSLYVKLVGLYEDISNKALENEKPV
jgi:hypothetical protein